MINLLFIHSDLVAAAIQISNVSMGFTGIKAKLWKNRLAKGHSEVIPVFCSMPKHYERYMEHGARRFGNCLIQTVVCRHRWYVRPSSNINVHLKRFMTKVKEYMHYNKAWTFYVVSWNVKYCTKIQDFDIWKGPLTPQKMVFPIQLKLQWHFMI